MEVYTEDVRSLLDAVNQRYQLDTGVVEGEPSISAYVTNVIRAVNRALGCNLNPDTYYKHYHSRIKNHKEDHVGYSINYLNMLSKYAHGKEYLNMYPRIVDDGDEIPEFPPEHPRFPATPAIRIEYGGYKDLWIKDESQCPVGVHKSRKAHELYLFYRRILREQLSSDGSISFPRLSIISAGYAALAIQYRFRAVGLPNLKVLVDKKISKDIQQMLFNSGAEVSMADLTAQKYSSDDVLRLTNNPGGIDLTYGYEVNEISGSFYDWLSYEVLNLNPNYIIVPYGSGELYRGLLDVHHRELVVKKNSKRYFGNPKILRESHFVGATAERGAWDTRMNSLVSYFDTQDPREIKELLRAPSCGGLSDIYEVPDDKYVDEALEIAERHHIRTCPSGIAGLTLLLRKQEEWGVHKDARIVIVNTGVVDASLFSKPLQ